MTDVSPVIDRSDVALLVLLSILWGGGYVLAGIVLKDLPPLVVYASRRFRRADFVAGGLALPGPAKRAWGWMPFFVMGLLNNVIPFALAAMGQTSQHSLDRQCDHAALYRDRDLGLWRGKADSAKVAGVLRLPAGSSSCAARV